MADIELERHGAVQLLRLNRPASRNALNGAVMAGLGHGIRDADADPEVAVIVITGTGDRAFCAGLDLGMKVGVPAGADDDVAAINAFFDFQRNGCTKPTIAAANGTAVGGGFELLLACDLAVASTDARFGLPEVKRGMLPGGGGVLLPQRVPLALALEILLTGNLFDAERALQLGLVNRLAAPEDVLSVAFSLAEDIAANGPLAVRAIKRLARAAGTIPSEQFWALQAQLAPGVFGSDDAKEGAAAFMEKRPPVWRGA